MSEAVTVARDSLAERAYLQPPASVWRSIAATAGASNGDESLIVALPERPGSTVEVERHPGVRRSFVLVALVLALVVVLLAVLLGLVFA
jgi:hypothetical protein